MMHAANIESGFSTGDARPVQAAIAAFYYAAPGFLIETDRDFRRYALEDLERLLDKRYPRRERGKTVATIFPALKRVFKWRDWFV